MDPVPKTQSFNNPLTFPSITDLLVAIINVLIVIATPIVVFMIIYSGFMYVTARGNPQKIQEASKAITFAVIGGVVIMGALAIVVIIQNVVRGFS